MRSALTALAFMCVLAAQPRFEAASIRPSAQEGEGSGRERVDVTSTNLTMRNASLSFAIQWAYGLQFYQVSGPEWLGGQRYDIQAAAPGPLPESGFREMMQALLKDRFGLAMHSEQRQRPVYSLTVRQASKLRPAQATDAPSFGVTGGDFVFRATSMSEFAGQLSDFATVDRPVVDNTGLAGRFHFTLESAARATRGGEGPSIFTAVSEVGLQLRPVTQAILVFVIDHADRTPSEN